MDGFYLVCWLKNDNNRMERYSMAFLSLSWWHAVSWVSSALCQMPHLASVHILNVNMQTNKTKCNAINKQTSITGNSLVSYHAIFVNESIKIWMSFTYYYLCHAARHFVINTLILFHFRSLLYRKYLSRINGKITHFHF